MNIEEMKARLFDTIRELETDIATLELNIALAKNALEKVHTLDDAKAFSNEINPENGLKHIKLY